MGLQSASAAYDSAISDGYSPNEALAYGIMSGTSEALMQKALGGIESFGTSSASKIAGKSAVKKQFDDILKRVIKNPTARDNFLKTAAYFGDCLLYTSSLSFFFKRAIFRLRCDSIDQKRWLFD